MVGVAEFDVFTPVGGLPADGEAAVWRALEAAVALPIPTCSGEVVGIQPADSRYG